jgi:hypothetical protein
MALLNKTGITNGGTIQAEHVTRAIDALTGVSTDTIIVTGSFLGTLDGSATSASFAVSASRAVSSSFATSASFVTSASFAVSASRAVSSSFSTTASYALNVGTSPERMTLHLYSGTITGVTSGSAIWVGNGVTSSAVNRVGVALPYDCALISASISLSTPSAFNASFNSVTVYLDSMPVTTLGNLDPKTVNYDSEHKTLGSNDGNTNNLVSFAFTSTSTQTGLCSLTAAILIEKK